MPLELFYSYAREDETLRNQLNKHLSALEREGLIIGWHDRKISAGSEWQDQIDEHLRSAHIILFLVSADFIASDYCYDVEVREALERHARHEAVVIPIILRSVDWSRTPFAKLQALPRDGKPVTSWANQDEAFTNIVQGIGKVAERYIVTSAVRGIWPQSSKLKDNRVSQDRVLDAAIASHIVKDLATELFVQIHLPDSPGLKGVLQEEEEHEARPEDVRSKPFGVVFPLGPDGRPEELKTAIRLESPDFSPPQQAKNLYIPPDKDSDVVDFLLTPRRTGKLKVLVELQWEDALRGSRSLRTECVAEATSLPAQTQMNVMRIPLKAPGATPHEPQASKAAASSAGGSGVILQEPSASMPSASVERYERYDQAIDYKRDYEIPSERRKRPGLQPSREAGIKVLSRARTLPILTRIVLALIAIIPATLVGYWQFVYKPSHHGTVFESVVVSGQVLNAQTLAFVPDAHIILDVDGTTATYEKYTDSNGIFSFRLTKVKPGAQGKLSVRKSGFNVLEKNFFINDTSISQELRLETTIPVPPPSPRPISLVVAGRVIDAATSTGLSHANVSLAGRAESSLTDDNGNFRIRLTAPVSTEGVRLQIKKAGCHTYDEMLRPPVENHMFELSCKLTAP